MEIRYDSATQKFFQDAIEYVLNFRIRDVKINGRTQIGPQFPAQFVTAEFNESVTIKVLAYKEPEENQKFNVCEIRLYWESGADASLVSALHQALIERFSKHSYVGYNSEVNPVYVWVLQAPLRMKAKIFFKKNIFEHLKKILQGG